MRESLKILIKRYSYYFNVYALNVLIAFLISFHTKAQDIVVETDGTCITRVYGNPFSWAYANGDAPDDSYVSTVITQPGNDYGFTFDIYGLDNSFNMEINGVSIASEEIQFQSNNTEGINIEFEDGDQYVQDTPEIWEMNGNDDFPMLRVVISPTGEVHLFGSKESYGPLFPLQPIIGVGNEFSFGTCTWNESSTNEIEVVQLVTGATNIDGYGYGMSLFTPPGIGVGEDVEVCEGVSVTLTANNPDDATISWNNGVTDGDGFIPPVGTTVYTATADRKSTRLNSSHVRISYAVF